MIKNALGSVIVVACGLAVVAPAAAEDALRLGDQLRLSPLVAEEGAAHLSFTPRASGVFDLETARLQLNVTPLEPARASRATSRLDDAAGERLAIGGALDFGNVEIEGGLAHHSFRGGRMDGVDAAVGIGAFTTRMSYAEIGGADGASESRYQLGADVETAPGLNIGADIAVSDGADADDADTAGVVRFRLSF